uniref:CIRCULARLY PERMUTED (1-3,1-4)-BETA-D-GLUCAN 4-GLUCANOHYDROLASE CPA16M-127 n=1 Tax=Paenibacillus macerans TaxID=44252 RepID=UPI000011053B|nr:Chain A, CIRCULARLY PERMUTED (1-3,1-4)-BETA-D-GLUCAN 4-GLUCANOHYDROLASE CPA16M-127 [Paenibacillus macerans]1AJO_B Chain B, CIRCULARLY PERMUTED (1-3,1-4)-BETA-D-GLUCAN 4-GLUCANOHYDROLASE CPA16M-127 [Paenibacillus macerans]
VGGHEKVISLGFDASKGFHTYAFDWQPGYIKWYVDGVLKHTATANIPSTPGKIMMNLWNGTGVDDWLGSYNGANPLYAEYDWVKYTSNQTGGSFFEPFNSYNSGTWEKADGYSNGGVFNCTWRANNVNFTNDGKLKLGLTSSAYNKFDCAEYRSTNIYGYGLYEVSMKPAKNTGIVSSFFTYTGPAHGTQWDEIDIEFLGKDTTKVQFNYYTNG